MARLAAERLGDTRLAIEIYNSVLAESRRGSSRDARGARGALRAREALPRARRDPASPARRRCSGKEAIALLEKLGAGLRRSARRAGAGRGGVAGDPRDRAEPREGAAHAARAVRDGRRLRRASRSCTRGSARKTSSSRRCSAIADRLDAKARAVAARRARGAARAAARRRGKAARRRRRSSARARSGSACSRSSRTHVGAARGARADLREAGEVGAPDPGARDRARGGAG